MNDGERIDWLERTPSRFHDVYWRMINEGETARQAIDALALLQSRLGLNPSTRNQKTVKKTERDPRSDIEPGSIIPTKVRCSRGAGLANGCPGTAKWMPVLLTRHRADKKTRAIRFLDIGLCEMHKDFLVLDDILCDEGWTAITKHIREHGFPPPKRNLTKLSFEPFVSSDPKAHEEALPF